MDIRTYRPGDELEQMQIYNAAAERLPRFKPASAKDVQRRIEAKDFDPATRLYAEEQGKLVGYCTFQANGRVGYPWCLPGYESAAGALLARTLQSMKERGIRKAFTAYRKDWPAITGFFESHGFKLAREMMNYVMEFEKMPTAHATASNVTPAAPDDIPAIFNLDPTVFRAPGADAPRQALWANPYFTSESIFVLRDRGGHVQAAGIFITKSDYADPCMIDSAMPCFRLGAFGTEGMTHKRVKGLFSFVARPNDNAAALGMELLHHASTRLEDEVSRYASQVASDAEALHEFYQQHFEPQGSFPVYEKTLG